MIVAIGYAPSIFITSYTPAGLSFANLLLTRLPD
jgi:hypothetical protein